MTNNKKRPVSVYALLFFMFIQGISGIAGGYGLVMDPIGEFLQLSVSLLENSPFSDYLIPGLILLIVLGIFPLFVFYGLLRKIRMSWYGAAFVGISLIIWIVVEIIIIGYFPQPPLQLIYGSVGLVILILVSLPSVKRHYLQ